MDNLEALHEHGITTRTFNYLKDAGFRTVQDLAVSEEDLLQVTGIGPSAITELREVLRSYTSGEVLGTDCEHVTLHICCSISDAKAFKVAATEHFGRNRESDKETLQRWALDVLRNAAQESKDASIQTPKAAESVHQRR